MPRIGPTLMLMVASLTLAIVVGIPFGVAAAVRQYSSLDYTLTGLTMLFISTPTFVLGLILIYLFAVTLQILPVGGMVTVGREGDPLDRLAHLVMPTLILGLAYAAQLMRYTRAGMIEVLLGQVPPAFRPRDALPLLGHLFGPSARFEQMQLGLAFVDFGSLLQDAGFQVGDVQTKDALPLRDAVPLVRADFGDEPGQGSAELDPPRGADVELAAGPVVDLEEARRDEGNQDQHPKACAGVACANHFRNLTSGEVMEHVWHRQHG